MSEYLFNGINPKDSEFIQTLDLLGGKGYNLSKMAEMGVNVPPFFVISTMACRDYQQAPVSVMTQVEKMLPFIKDSFHHKFGYMPLVSVRSGAKVSMPGMMDTILNVGLCQGNLNEWRDRIGLHCAQDSYKRLGHMYKDVVGDSLPASPDAQLLGAIEAVFKSWNNDRAKTYRKLNNIDDSLGTAVVIQAMVFGNMNEKSCTGVLFTRDPSSGENKVVGEFLPNAQGEDVVAGTVTPKPLKELASWNQKVSDELLDIAEKLELHYKDMQDIEFTVQDGELFILQTRSGKRTSQAAVRVAVDLVKEGILTIENLKSRLSLKQYLNSMQPSIKSAPEPKVVGIAASNGVAVGVAVLSSKSAVNCKEPCILVANETTPEDIEGMHAAKGILTKTGGLTSHAAVVARGMDRVCVVGCTNLPPIQEGDKLVICGATGRVWINQNVVVETGSDNHAVSELHAMLQKEFGYMNLTTKASEVKAEGSFYSALGLSGGPAMHLFLQSIVKKMDKGIIDVRSEKEVPATPFDTTVMGIFHSAESGDLKLDRLNALPTIDPSKKDISIIAGSITSVHKKGVESKGYKVVTSLKSVGDLIMANGVVIGAFEDNSLTKAQLAKLLEMKKAVGDNFKSLEIDPKGQVNTDAVMTDLQVAQAVLR